MHTCKTLCAVIFAVIFLLVVGTLVFASLTFQQIKTQPDASTGMAIAAIVTASLALVGMLAAFIYYTVTTYDDGNWLHWLVDKSTALEQRAKQKWAEAGAQLKRAQVDFEKMRLKLLPNQTKREQAKLQKASEAFEKAALNANLPPPIANDFYQNLPPISQLPPPFPQPLF